MKRVVLENGLRVISLKKPKDFASRIVVGINYGPIYEKEKTSALPHFLEHMIFRDTKKHTYEKIIEKMYSCGGFMNAYTVHENLIYYANSLSKNFKNILNPFFEIILKPGFKLKDFKKEKQVILNEISKIHDDPYIYIDKIFFEALYKKKILLPLYGTKASVKNLNLEDVVNTYKKYFVPNNMIIGIFGNFKDNTIVKIKNTFQNLKKKKIDKPPIPKEDKKPSKKKIIEIRKDIAQSYIQTGTKTVPMNNKDAPVFDVISTLIGSNESSRLARELRLKRGLVYNVLSLYIRARNYGHFIILSEAEKQNIEKIFKIIKIEFKKLREKKISKNELEKSKNIAISDYLFSFDSPIDGPNKFVEYESILGNINKLKLYLKKIESVTAKDVLEVANKYFDEENFATAIIRPK